MFSSDDTIAAIATPIGPGGVGLIRISGPHAVAMAARLSSRVTVFEPRRATLVLIDQPPGVRDRALVTVFPAPQSYTGEDVVEVSAHGSPVLLRGLLEYLHSLGARLAGRGEFTLRAYAHGKIDLVQAEAVADLIEAVTPLQTRVACDQLHGTVTSVIQSLEAGLFDVIVPLEASLDFPDEGYHFIDAHEALAAVDALRDRIANLLARARVGRLVREGARVAIVGAPNVGKSSLFNALVAANRAIVTPIPGTTRDVLSERADIRGLSVTLFDTAGLRESDDVIEQEGMARARAAAASADLVLIVLDRSRVLTRDDRAALAELRGSATLVVANKADLPAAWSPDVVGEPLVEVSAATGVGLDLVGEAMWETLGRRPDWSEDVLVTNVRHQRLLGDAASALTRASSALRSGGVPEEFVLADLQDASASLQEVTGRRTSEDVLRAIFERFCIGK